MRYQLCEVRFKFEIRNSKFEIKSANIVSHFEIFESFLNSKFEIKGASIASHLLLREFNTNELNARVEPCEDKRFKFEIRNQFKFEIRLNSKFEISLNSKFEIRNSKLLSSLHPERQIVSFGVFFIFVLEATNELQCYCG